MAVPRTAGGSPRLVLLSRSKARWTSAGLGAAAGVLALFNPETAVASAAGYVVFLVLRLRSWRSIAASAGVFAVGALAVVAIWIGTFRVAFDKWPFPSSAASVVDMAGRYAGGLGGLPSRACTSPCSSSATRRSAGVRVLSASLRPARGDPGGGGRHDRGLVRVLREQADTWNLWTLVFLWCFLLDGWLHPDR